MTKQKVSSLRSKLAIIIGIAMILLSPFIFVIIKDSYVASSTDFLPSIGGTVYGYCGAALWLLISLVVIAYGILRYTSYRKA
jgi:hypothetical protein